MALRRSDLFGFVPGGPVLDAEEEYGEYDPQNWHQRRGGPVVAAEEAYGGKFSLSDEDDDVAFAGDLEDVDLFTDSFGKEGGDEVDNQLDQILSEMDKEDFGAYSGEDALAIAPGLEAYRNGLADIIREGVRSAFIGEAEGVQSMFQRGADWVSNKFEQLVAPGDMEEIAQALMSGAGEGPRSEGVDLAFCHWNELSDSARESLVHNAIWYAMWPGVEVSVDDKLWEAWQSGIGSLPSSAFEIAKAAVTADLPKIAYAAFAEHPMLGNMMQAAGWDPQNADQMKNERAMLLWLLGKFGFPVDAYVAKAITDQGQDVISACQAATSGGSSISAEAEGLAEELVAPPVQELPDSGWQMPSPEQILAAGYGLSIIGSLAGIFS